ncbi:MAG: PilZ domain-containing protein [Polyangiaceae bacterium]
MSDAASRPKTSRPPPGGVEQRLAQRSALEVEVSMTSDSHFFVGLTNDISTGGLFVSTYRDLAVGAQLELEFALPEGTVKVVGTVRWRRDASDVSPGVGISFEKLSPSDEKIIRRFCDKRPPLYYDLDD